MMASCSKESETTTIPSDSAASFTSSITRASGESWEDKDQVGIMVTNGTTTLSGYKFNALYDVDPSTSEFSAHSDLDKFYYPVDGTSIHFYAYYPYSTAVNATDASYPIDVAVQSTPRSIDFMEASTKGGTGYSMTSGDVDLQFNRGMTKMTFTLKAGAGIELANISAISLEGFYTTASYDFATNSFGAFGAVKSIIPYTEAVANTYSAILIPTHDGDTAVTAHSNPKVKFVVSGEELYWDLKDETLKSGENNSYEVTITRSMITTAKIKSWNPTDKDELIAK